MKQLGERDASTVTVADQSSQAEAAALAVFRAAGPYVAQDGNEDLLHIVFTRIRSLTLNAINATQGQADAEWELRDFKADAYLKAAQMQADEKKNIERVLGLLAKARRYSQKPISLEQVGDNDWLNTELCGKASTGAGLGDWVNDPKVPVACGLAAQFSLASNDPGKALDLIATARKYATGPIFLDGSAPFNNNLCWQGSISEGAFFKNPEIIAACDRAALLSNRNPEYLDSRAVNRARNGDYEGAIADFRPYTTDPKTPTERRQIREAWIGLLQKGQDPFTPATLQQMQRGW